MQPHRSTVLLLILALSAGAAVAQGAQRADLPLFDLAQGRHSLAINVAEERFGEGEVYPWVDLQAHLTATGGSRSLAGAVLAYLDLAVAGDFERLGELVAAGTDPATARQQARLLHLILAQAGTPEEVRLERAWSFGPYRVVLLRVSPRKADAEDRGKDAVFALSLRREEERYAVAGDWGELQPVNLMFWYLAGNFQQGLVGGQAARSFSHSLTLGAASDPLTLHFDADWYDPASDWSVAETDADPSSAAGFARRALAIAAADDDVGFLELWDGAEKAKIVGLQARSPALYDGLKSELAAGLIKDVATVHLGEFHIHYFVERSDPSQLRALVLRRENDALRLSRELYTNIESLMTSAQVKDRLRATWSQGS